MKISTYQKKTFVKNFLFYSIAFIVIKMIFDKGIPETGLGNLILTGIIFGVILGAFNMFFLKKPKDNDPRGDIF